MKTLIVRGEKNTPGKKDFTGAFLPESQTFKMHHDPQAAVCSFDNTLPFAKRLPQLIKNLSAFHQDELLDTLAIFCHGWSTGIQAGVTETNMKLFLEALDEFDLSTSLHVLLYCCSTGDDKLDHPEQGAGSSESEHYEGDGSFADTLRDALCKRGLTECRVLAHTTAGHTTENPYAILFDGMGSSVGGVGGIMPVTEKNPKMWRAWKKLLKTPYRFEYSFETVGEIHDRVASAGG